MVSSNLTQKEKLQCLQIFYMSSISSIRILAVHVMLHVNSCLADHWPNVYVRRSDFRAMIFIVWE